VSEIDPKLSRLYREASSEQPPAALDDAILAAARKRTAKARSRELSPWWRWMAPASAIATLVLGVSLALLIERERPETINETSIRPTPPQRPPSARAGESATPKTADHAAPAAAAKQETPAASAARAFPAERRTKAAEPGMSAPKAALESNVAGDSAPRAAGAVAAPAPAAASGLAPMPEQAAQRSAEAWLEEIGRLSRAGRDQDAAEQLAQFRKAYPGHTVPEGLLPK